LHNHSLSFMMQTAFGRAEESGDFMGRVWRLRDEALFKITQLKHISSP
jgi:hypothetical protein